jgi:TPR repeat protein
MVRGRSPTVVVWAAMVAATVICGRVASAQPCPDPNVCGALCRQGTGSACTAAGLEHLRGHGAGRDPLQAARFFKRGCDLADGAGCTALGNLFLTGEGIKKNDGRAYGLYQRACARQDPAGCRNLGNLYAQGRGVPRQNDALAASFYRRACKAADGRACHNLAVMSAEGRGISRDEAEAAALHAQACGLGEGTSCSRLADIYGAGLGVPRNATRAAALRREACLKGDKASCLEPRSDSARTSISSRAGNPAGVPPAPLDGGPRRPHRHPRTRRHRQRPRATAPRPVTRSASEGWYPPAFTKACCCCGIRTCTTRRVARGCWIKRAIGDRRFRAPTSAADTGQGTVSPGACRAPWSCCGRPVSPLIRGAASN